MNAARALVRIAALVTGLAASAGAQPDAETSFEFDLLIDGGHVLDPKSGLDRVMDIGIKDTVIAAVADDIDPSRAERVIDAGGLFVTPGLIDLHVHAFWGKEPGYSRRGDDWWSYRNSYGGVRPDAFAPRAGVTTVVDAGSSGWRDFPIFLDEVVNRSTTRVLAFLNIVGAGMNGSPAEQDLTDMDARLTAQMAARFPGVVVGVKLAHFRGHDWEPTRRAVGAGEQAGVPVMVDFGGADPPLPLAQLLLDELRPGDILTHCFARTGGRESVVDSSGIVPPWALEARDRGIVFDVGHGGGSFRFNVAVPAVAQGLKPTTISSDLHAGSMNRGMKDMANLLSKSLALGLSWPEVVEAATWRPAQVIDRQDLGHLSAGAVADVAVFRIEEGDFGYVDVRRRSLRGTQRVRAELTIRAGSVAWDLNGLAATPWDETP